MPLVYDHTIPDRIVEKVNTLKEFLKSCLELMQDETTLNTLCRMIDHLAPDKEIPTKQKAMNQVLCKKRTNKEFKLSA
jgi:hypothetical protein